MISVRWWPPTPSQARTCFWSVRHRASVPSRVRSRRADLRAVSSGQARAQRRRGERCGVQGLEGGVLDGGAEAAEVLGRAGASAEPESGGEQREDGDAQAGRNPLSVAAFAESVR